MQHLGTYVYCTNALHPLICKTFYMILHVGIGQCATAGSHRRTWCRPIMHTFLQGDFTSSDLAFITRQIVFASGRTAFVLDPAYSLTCFAHLYPGHPVLLLVSGFECKRQIQHMPFSLFVPLSHTPFTACRCSIQSAAYNDSLVTLYPQ